MNPTYESYSHWRTMMTETAGLTLDADYCKERISVLTREKDASTVAFINLYGAKHRDQIVRWFEKALAEK